MKLNHSQYFEYRFFDYLIDKNIRFAVYRLPGEHDINLIIQNSPHELQFDSISDLNHKQGFVIAPFSILESSPIVLIAPETVLKGEDAILEYLVGFAAQNHKTNNSQSATSGVSYSFDTYKDAFGKFKTALVDSQFEKLVLSRTFDHRQPEDYRSGISFRKACDIYADNFIYLCHTPQTGTWLGCSPELFVSGHGSDWQTVALAGTQEVQTSANWDEKNIQEQQIVTNYMQQQLQKAGCSFTQQGPFTIQTANLKHLKTEFNFSLSDSDNMGSLLQLLHPSPAVCGFPKEEAFNFIIQNEGYDRQYYSGFLGCLNMADQTDLYVNLRCMKINKDTLRLYAGGGLLPSSELESEWDETEHKLQTILAIVI